MPHFDADVIGACQVRINSRKSSQEGQVNFNTRAVTALKPECVLAMTTDSFDSLLVAEPGRLKPAVPCYSLLPDEDWRYKAGTRDR
jgi:hypothetical protein